MEEDPVPPSKPVTAETAPKQNPAPEEEELSAEEKEAKQRKEQAKTEKELGNQCYKRKEFAKAIEHYDAALAMDDTDVTIMNNKAGKYQTC
jgi:stress-induced-phosphoprotein 1